MSSYSGAKKGVDYPGYDIKCTQVADSTTGIDYCEQDPSCVGYTEVNGIRCNKYYIDKAVESKGSTSKLKKTDNCIQLDNMGEYAAGYCISNNLSIDEERKKKLIKEMEAKKTKLLMLGTEEDRLLFILYSNNAKFYREQIPFMKGSDRQITLYVYGNVTISEEGEYRLETSGDSYSEFYINGVSTDNYKNNSDIGEGYNTGYLKLTHGEYFISVSQVLDMKNIDGDKEHGIYIVKEDGSKLLFTDYITKNVDFITRVDSGDKTPFNYTYMVIFIILLVVMILAIVMGKGGQASSKKIIISKNK